MQQFSSLLSWRSLTAQHVSGVFPPIIRSSMTAVAASGFTFVSWWQSCCVCGRAGRPARPQTQHQVGDLFELNVKLRCQKVNVGLYCIVSSDYLSIQFKILALHVSQLVTRVLKHAELQVSPLVSYFDERQREQSTQPAAGYDSLLSWRFASLARIMFFDIKISGFHRKVYEIYSLLGYYPARSGNFLPKFRDL